MTLLDHPVVLFLVLFLGFLLIQEVGFRLGSVSGTNAHEQKHKQVEETRNQIMVLLSLLLGFTLSMALIRFDYRVHLVVDEANSIGTTYLRAQLLSEPARSQAMKLLQGYVDTRLELFGTGVAPGVRQQAAAHSRQVQDELWQQAVASALQSPTPITATYIQALNDTIDHDGKRAAAFQNRVPRPIWLMLILIAVLTSLTVGYSQRHRVLVSMIVPPLMIAIVMSLIADMDSPRGGFILASQQSMKRLQSDLRGTAGR